MIRTLECREPYIYRDYRLQNKYISYHKVYSQCNSEYSLYLVTNDLSFCSHTGTKDYPMYCSPNIGLLVYPYVTDIRESLQ